MVQEEEKNKITIGDVAEALGISKTTYLRTCQKESSLLTHQYKVFQISSDILIGMHGCTPHWDGSRSGKKQATAGKRMRNGKIDPSYMQ